MTIRSIALICISAIVLCHPALSISVIFDFKCNSNDESSTLSHYSQTRGTWEDGSSTPLGYETRSFSYLADGQIEFEDAVDYKEGYMANDMPSISYGMTVSFKGQKGISQLSARGTYLSDGEILSTRTVRYGDEGSLADKSNLADKSSFDALSKLVENLGLGRDPSLASGSNCTDCSEPKIGSNARKCPITVSAELEMSQARKGYGGYSLVYNASVPRGFVDTLDTTGWTHEIGAVRNDWEQASWMTGNITVEDNLLAGGLLSQ